MNHPYTGPPPEYRESEDEDHTATGTTTIRGSGRGRNMTAIAAYADQIAVKFAADPAAPPTFVRSNSCAYGPASENCEAF
jgi:hypothetical protein